MVGSERKNIFFELNDDDVRADIDDNDGVDEEKAFKSLRLSRIKRTRTYHFTSLASAAAVAVDDIFFYSDHFQGWSNRSFFCNC